MSSDESPVRRSEPLHQQVARNIRNAIESGRMRHGQRLPSTRELAEEWGVSVFTISQAMDVLARDGLVVSKARAGRVVNAPDQLGESVINTGPTVVMIGGFAGSGKTEFGRILSRRTGWPILDKDTLTRFVVESALEMSGLSRNDRESPEYLEKIRPGEYACLLEAISENVQCGNSVIATAPFLREFSDNGWLHRTKSALHKLGAELALVWMACDAETMHNYIRHRDAARDFAKLADWTGYVTGIDLDFRPALPHTVVDNSATGGALAGQADQLLSQLDSREVST